MYFCMIDVQTPLQAKAIIAGALAYFLSPADAIPDAIVGVGFTDDASVIATALVTVSTHVTDKTGDKQIIFLEQADDFLEHEEQGR